MGIYNLRLEIEDNDSIKSGQTKSLVETFEVEVLNNLNCMGGFYSDLTIDTSLDFLGYKTNSL